MLGTIQSRKGWHLLPGAADYIDAIVRDLVDGIPVWIYFPNAPENFSTYIRARMKHGGFQTWKRLETLEDLDQLVHRDSFTYWHDIQSDERTARVTLEQKVREVQRLGGYLRLGLLASSNSFRSLSVLRNTKTVRVQVRAWSDFVTMTDSRIVVERIGRQHGWSNGYIKIISSVVCQIVKNNIFEAYRYACKPLEEILSDTSLREQDLWVAQVEALFPQVNSERRRIIKKYIDRWRVPHVFVNELGQRRTIRNVKQLELSHLCKQCEGSLGLIEAVDYDELRFLKQCRNLLAHQRVLNWGHLSSKEAVRAFDIRIPS